MNATLTRRAILKLLGGLSALSIVPAGLSACTGGGSGSQGQGGGSRKIGVLQLTEHPALDASNKGFVDALDEAGITYNIDQQNAQNDQSACQTIAHKLVNDGNDLILAIATPAAQAVAGATDEIPIVGTAITDFASAGLVQSNDKPGKNVTGSSDLTPVADQFDLLVKLLPQAKTVGVLYCTAESNSDVQVKLADQAAANHGLKLVRYSVSSSNEIQQVVESMVGKVDVVYTPTDNTIAAGMTTVTMIANDNKLPTICGEEGMVDNGGLATYGINYEELGKLAGQMAVKILKGESKPADMAIEHLDASKCTLKTNEETAKKLGIDLSVLNS
ncbi:ABC transporter substrate-binding protein [Olsenella sp. oral taxon 807]|uniref:ABC transporter substrate-binding protein n=1 Tax=Olsenella sp. oral taxon 807 TaxID=712411 RepID=UPI00067A0523|nr:ABC transporter substrate-binding protein [Olsenella sp. oral taxon 807]AKT48915.1 ABC transporter substrate-binding protein [Olsenella sp. oral taxon 807]